MGTAQILPGQNEAVTSAKEYGPMKDKTLLYAQVIQVTRTSQTPGPREPQPVSEPGWLCREQENTLCSQRDALFFFF